MAECKPSLDDDLTLVFDKQELCDVIFDVDGQAIGAHKLILKVRSQHLFDMASEWNHENQPIKIQDMTYGTFKAILRFMYSGQIEISNASVFICLTASVQFKMNSLERLCVHHIAKSMSTENVCVYMNDAINFKSTLLQKKCSEIFSQNTFAVLFKQSIKDLSQSTLSALLDADKANIVEIELFHYIRKWMVQQCIDHGLPVNGTNMRHVIGDALYKIRFPTMNVQDFANYVTTIKGLLTDSEMAQIFQKITVLDSESIECPFPDKFRCMFNVYHMPSHVIEKFLNTRLVPSIKFDSKYLFKCSSALKIIKEAPGNEDIWIPMHSIYYISQCIADLANSSPLPYMSCPLNQDIRNELYDEFLAWQDTVKTKNVCDIMTKFKKLRKKAHKLY